MKIQTSRVVPAALLAASALLAVPAFAAGHIDPKVVGHWRGTFPGPTKSTPTVDLVLKPTGAETMTVNIPQHPIVFHATYTTAPGVLTMTRTNIAPGDKESAAHKTQKLKYTVTGTTLLLDDGTPTGRVLFHRVKG